MAPRGDLGLFAGLTLLSMAIIAFLPKLTKAIPGGLTAILVVFGLTAALGLETKTVGDLAWETIQGGFPPFHIPEVPLTLETLQVIFPYAVIVAGSG